MVLTGDKLCCDDWRMALRLGKSVVRRVRWEKRETQNEV